MIRSDDLDELMDREAAAALIKSSVPTLDRLIKNREIEIVRIGGRGRGRVFITRRALLDFLNKQRVPAKKTAAS